jgi:hypothetical protein
MLVDIVFLEKRKSDRKKEKREKNNRINVDLD